MLKEEMLRLADLTKIEAKTLEALLRLGPSPPSSIVRESGLFRPQVYDALGRLGGRNLVSFIVRNNRRVYSATDPSAIVDILRKKQESIAQAIPQIMVTYSAAAKENVTILSGIAGLKIMLNTTMSELEREPVRNIYRVMLTDATPINLLKGWLRRWHKTRARRGFKAMLIFTPDAAWRGRQLETHAATQIRYAQNIQKIPVGIHSCGKFAWVIFWGEESPFAIQIEDEKIARAFDDYFERLWIAAVIKAPKSSSRWIK